MKMGLKKKTRTQKYTTDGDKKQGWSFQSFLKACTKFKSRQCPEQESTQKGINRQH